MRDEPIFWGVVASHGWPFRESWGVKWDHVWQARQRVRPESDYLDAMIYSQVVSSPGLKAFAAKYLTPERMRALKPSRTLDQMQETTEGIHPWGWGYKRRVGPGWSHHSPGVWRHFSIGEDDDG